ncbi:hypothetical protein GCM10023317_91550 [Actinopolymorpha pittospori]
MLTRHRTGAVLYVGTGLDLLQPVPTARTEDTVDLVLHTMAQGRTPENAPMPGRGQLDPSRLRGHRGNQPPETAA